MTTEAQKRASLRYQSKLKSEGRLKAYNMTFYEKDMDAYEHLQKQPNKAAYVVGLIRQDMARGGE